MDVTLIGLTHCISIDINHPINLNRSITKGTTEYIYLPGT